MTVFKYKSAEKGKSKAMANSGIENIERYVRRLLLEIFDEAENEEAKESGLSERSEQPRGLDRDSAKNKRLGSGRQ